MGFSLFASLGLDGNDFTSGLKKAETEAKGFGNRLDRAIGGAAQDLQRKLAGLFTVTAATQATRKVVEWGGNIADTADKLNMSTTAVQEWDYAVKQSGGTIEDVAAGMKALSRAREDALSGTPSAAKKLDVFQALGIDEQSLRDNPLDRIFRDVAAGFQSVDFGAGELAAVSELLGKAGSNLLPAFKNGLAAAAEEAERLGLVLNDETIEALDKMGDSFDRLWAQIRAGAAPVLAWIAEKLNDMLNGAKVVSAWIGGFMGTSGTFIDKLRGADTQATEMGQQILDEEEASKQKRERKKANIPGSGEGEEEEEAIRKGERVLRLREQIEEIRRRTAERGMSEGEKEMKLVEEIAKLKQQLDALWSGWGTAQRGKTARTGKGHGWEGRRVGSAPGNARGISHAGSKTRSVYPR